MRMAGALSEPRRASSKLAVRIAHPAIVGTHLLSPSLSPAAERRALLGSNLVCAQAERCSALLKRGRGCPKGGAPSFAGLRVLTGFLLFLLICVGPSSMAADRVIPAPKSPWGRVVMIGASATAGFTASEMLGGTNTQLLRLSRYVDAALIPPHEPVESLAHALFFMQPEAAGQNQIRDALEAKPTLVIGVDFLFWFCYGTQARTDAERQKRFEHGLKLLGAIECPLIVGDIPDASAAVGGMLSESQMPSAASMAAANRRLKEWAVTRPKVVVMPLAAFMRAAMANQPLVLRGHTWQAGQTRRLLQDDMLHPSPPGAAALAFALMDVFQSTRPQQTTNEIRWNPTEILRLGSKTISFPALRTTP